MAIASKHFQAQSPINLASDGEGLSPLAYAELLARLTREREVRADSFGAGGIVAEFEDRVAALLGKERAILMPTGTLANMLALDRLAGPGKRRAIVQRDGHILNDTGDSCERVMGLKLIALQDNEAGFTAAAVAAELTRAATARVAVPVGVISIETPVRRRHAQLVAESDIDAVVALGRREGIALHLDGARLFVAAAATGRSVRQYADLFDTVYVSLYKYMNVPFGAVLAGPAAIIDGLRHDRRRHGGGLNQFWLIALVAGHGLDGLEETWKQALARMPPVLDRVAASGRARIAPFPHASNIRPLAVPGVDPARMARIAAAALARGLKLPEPEGDTFWIRANAGWTRIEPDDLAQRVIEALGA
jgi:threonine aldolase